MSDAEMRLFVVATEAASITGALENLRSNRLDRALEALEQQLDTATVMLDEIAKKVEPDDQERAIQTLRLIRDYRRLQPRRSEVDMSKFDPALVQEVYSLQERARRILEEIT
jgi:hypothetical protein